MEQNNDFWIIKEDNVCPATGDQCDDECCPPGAQCNLRNSGDMCDKSNPIFVLEIGGGDYSCTWNSIAGVFTDIETAEKAKAKIIEERKVIADQLHPLLGDISFLPYRNPVYLAMSDEERKDIIKWKIRQDEAKEVWSFEITELETNAIIKELY